jgi:hypothetical protein
MTEGSIVRARESKGCGRETVRVSPAHLPSPDETFDAVFAIFAAHEQRSRAGRLALFREFARILKPQGRIFVVEHLRDWRNFLAYGPGFFHFFSGKEWLRIANRAGLRLSIDFTVTPFVKVFCFKEESMNTTTLSILLQAAAIAQVAVAALNLFLVRLMKWEPDLARMSLLVREVFRVHAWFISVTLGIFGALSWRFAAEMASGADVIGKWLCLGIGIFWAIRTVLQVTYYSSSHWRGQMGRTLAHVALLVCYGGMGVVYLWAGLRGGPV